MRMFNEEDILSPAYRKRVIEEIRSPENVARKKDARKRSEIFKDGTGRYVLEQLQRELDPDTVEEMKYRTSNISILKKIINKKARVYKNGIVREGANMDALDAMVDVLDFNQSMKKVNKYVELHRNCAVYVFPYMDPLDQKWKITLRVLDPSLYDVIEDSINPEKPRCFIFSYFNDEGVITSHNGDRSQLVSSDTNFRAGDGRDQVIADSPNDQGETDDGTRYVWWSNLYHFTTDSKGEIVQDKSPEDMKNPIGEMPFVPFAKDQDGAFWAVGGDDLVDGSILINQVLTDLYFISKVQGMGIFYFFGKGVPKTMKFGPNQAITHDMEEGDPTPNVGFASSNPPIESHMKMVEQYVALLLSTNDLEPSSVSGQLNAMNASSGIQEMIKHSEVTSAIEDEQEQFRDNEPKIVRIIGKWASLYQSKKILSEEQSELPALVDEDDLNIKFQPAQQFMTEKEKLEILALRKDLGLDDMIDLIMKDDPELSKEDAEKKLKGILEEKIKRSAQFTMKEEDANNEEEGDEAPEA